MSKAGHFSGFKAICYYFSVNSQYPVAIFPLDLCLTGIENLFKNERNQPLLCDRNSTILTPVQFCKYGLILFMVMFSFYLDIYFQVSGQQEKEKPPFSQFLIACNFSFQYLLCWFTVGICTIWGDRGSANLCIH